MADALIIRKPEETLKSLSELDRQILANTLITSPEDLHSTIAFLNTQTNLPNIQKNEIDEMKKDCFEILKQKIKLTKLALQINSAADAAIIPIPDAQQSQLEFNKTTKGKVIDGKEKFQEAANGKDKKNKSKIPIEIKTKVYEDDKQRTEIGVNVNMTVHTVKEKDPKAVSFQWFQGYERKKIYGTQAILPEPLQISVVNAQSESDIDNIARHLIEDGRIEDALNLSIDLFEERLKKNQQEIEKRFLFEILPWAYGVQSPETKDDMQNITLAIWNEQLKKKAESELIGQSSEVSNTTSITFEDFKKKVGEMMTPEGTGKAHKFFEENIKNISDLDKHIEAKTPEEEKDRRNLIWKEIVDNWKDTLQQAAEEGKESITTLDDIKKEGFDIIKKAKEAGGNAMNLFRQFLSKHKKVLNQENIKTVDLFKEIKDKVDIEVKPTEPVTSSKIIVTFNVAEKYPEIFEEAKKCKTINEFMSLIETLVFDSKTKGVVFKDHDAGYQVAANLSDQYISNFAEGSKMTDFEKRDWFNCLIIGISDRRKRNSVKDKKPEDAVIVEETKNEPGSSEANSTTSETKDLSQSQDVQQSTTETIDPKYEDIKTSKKNDLIYSRIQEFMLERNYKTPQERYNELRDKYLPLNNKWRKSPENERDNVLKKAIKTSPEILEMLK